ncbi:glycerophosphodiester phosphodiesterase family protein [Arthrobacter sp. MYb213]|uniref:glycerophosphodiester phosphodiesterase family protein n=1 Tax=Arthrobacter sp. MYb213 TaxID=1848595 RepID=UPI000CFD6D0E|nr:glycerophosphodiester phosphodiesterase family protein [Arthrobacter sp. MYb213]PRB70081.1 glycerophosphodiester phosphodiesterase [Arthrobacter sp. MYb213]
MTYAFTHRGIRFGDEENTLIAFQRAWDLGITHLETDVRTSKDGTVYAFHDETLDRVTDAAGALHEYTDEQLATVRAGGQPLCTLRELLLSFPDALLNIDVKDERAIAPLAKLIEELGCHGQIALASFESSRSAAVQHLISAPVLRSPGRWEMALIWLCAALFGRIPNVLARGFWAVQVPLKQGVIPVVTPRFIKAVQRAGLQVHVWVIDDEPTMRALMKKNVDAIMSDNGELLAKVLG